jgi:hypothetical protein
LAWDNDFFYLLGEAYDDHPFSGGADLVGQLDRCAFGAECEDSFMVLLDGRGNRQGGYSNDDHRLFFGLGGGIGFPSQGAPGADQVSVASARNGDRCYVVEARVEWQYLVGTNNGMAIPGQFPPADGQSYGFDIAISDSDPAATDPNRVERQSLLFWRSHGPNYRYETDGFGLMQLSGGN